MLYRLIKRVNGKKCLKVGYSYKIKEYTLNGYLLEDEEGKYYIVSSNEFFNNFEEWG